MFPIRKRIILVSVDFEKINYSIREWMVGFNKQKMETELTISILKLTNIF